jgi:hypothetical protein
LSDFKDLVPVYANINNTHVKDIKDIAHAKRNFEKSSLAGKTSDKNMQLFKNAFKKEERP